MFWDDPFDEFFRRAFEDFERPYRNSRYSKRSQTREPVTDVWENDDYVFVTAELPGVKKDDIDLNVEEDSIEIKAKSKINKREEKKDEKVYEQSYRNFYVRLDLPARVDTKNVDATFSNGILEVKLKKIKEKKNKIEIKEK